jgi:predicted transcriptional regulator
MPKFSLRGFKPDRQGVSHVLGELETAVMEHLWQYPRQTVSEVEDRLNRVRPIAHTTVLTTLDRLHRKGYLMREKEGKAFVYAPRYSREEFERGMAEEVLGAILKGMGEPVLSTFVDMVGEDEAQLQKLEALIREKRKGNRS